MLLRNLLLSLGISNLIAATPISSGILPTIDLGYAVYRASSYNEVYDSYIFSNIRFAAPPTGALRFGAPQPPLEDKGKINDGSVGFNCPQAEPTYLPDGKDPSPQSEDCLFLDVIVPRKVLSGDLGKVPVLFWVFGGGYTLGSKTGFGNPFNFLKDSPSPVIYVAPNYRLGFFGWLGGPTFTLSSGTVPNAGLYDQLLALKWVQDKIHLFNGKKDEVTVMGVSAGAGSIMHLITANGGEGEANFIRAVPLGPGYLITGGHSDAEVYFSQLERQVGCTGKGVDCLRSISSETLIKVNADTIAALGPPFTGPGPVVDGNLVPDVPSYLLAQGRFHKNITLLVSDDIDEGAGFLGQRDYNKFTQSVAEIFHAATNVTISEIERLYPAPSNTTPYTTAGGRISKLIADFAFNCNRYAMSTAFPNSTYNLLFSIKPGFHGTGPTLLFSDVPGSDAVITSQIQYGIRRSVMNFVVAGNPNEANGQGVSSGVQWPVFGSQGLGLEIDGFTMKVISASTDKEVCEWWAKSLIFS